MRYLKRIIFINSAHIKYAEINLDGNVHFTGTQGVGKSTILRAILFFYNADTQGLGIPKQKESYAEYYFKNANSFIIYEVCRDDGNFCIVSYKSQQKVCFRFFDAAFNKDYFVSSNGNVPDSWEPIARQLDQQKIFYTKRKIEEYKEYRDIIYGNHDDKKREFRRYSLLESKDYQYLPKTIQNVFLNSKMEAEFIKQTIIMSLGNDLKIDLSLHAHHLEGFETQIEDLRKFKHHQSRKLATNIADLHLQVRHLQEEKLMLASQLSKAFDLNEEQEPSVRRQVDKKKEGKVVILEKLNKAKENHEAGLSKLQKEIIRLEETLARARSAKIKYERLNIEAVIGRVLNKEKYVKEQKHLYEERNLLNSAFAEINLRYSSLIEQLLNQHNDLINSRNKEINKINEKFLEFKMQLFQKYNSIIEEVRGENKKSIDEARTELDERKEKVHELKLEKERLKHSRFFESEIIKQQEIIALCDKEIIRLNAEYKINKLAVETLEKQWSNEFEHLEKTGKIDLNLQLQKITDANSSIKDIEYYLENSHNSLFGWLNNNYADWENTIGKVIDEKNVLFETDLEPEFFDKSDSFYGVRLNLEQVNKKVKTIKDYEEEKLHLNDMIEAYKKEYAEIEEKIESLKENLKKRFLSKISERKTSLKEIDYYLQQNGIKLNNAKSSLIKLTQDATDEKKKKLEEIQHSLSAALNAESGARENLERVERELDKMVIAKQKERDKKIVTELERILKLKDDINQLIEASKKNFETREKEYLDMQKNDLLAKGADTIRLEEINGRLSIIDEELDYIDNSRDTVAEYKKDKRELLDKADDFTAQKEKLCKQSDLETKKYDKKKSELDRLLYALNEEIDALEIRLNEINEDKDLFNSFMETDLYKTLSFGTSGKSNQDGDAAGKEAPFDTLKRVRFLIEDLKEVHFDKLSSRMGELKILVIELTGKFSENNILKFKRQFSDDTSFLEFAEMLYDFMEENKIERIEKEVNERFALIITTIGRETANMIAEQGNIQRVIRKINDDFRDREIAVGVIKMIELKVDESKNEIFQLLKKIKEFNDENARELGSPNLFSSEESDKKNKEAVDLLKLFSKKINESRKEYILLSDSFDLKFRIEENQNNTGWVEKLSNVGSDGTDVLVKAMVNIMLLNVFKEGASRSFKDFKLHCMMDEIGKLHPTNVRGILKFANQRNILLINGSPIENDALAFKHIYQLKKDNDSNTRVKRLITQMDEVVSVK